jgi:hypothetical protein
MQHSNTEVSLETLREIRGIMNRSGRFLSLSGWSGIWAGAVASVAGYIAHQWIEDLSVADFSAGRFRRAVTDETLQSFDGDYQSIVIRFVLLAVCTMGLALAGALFFTIRKAKKQGDTLWNPASRQLLFAGALPFAVGGIFALAFLYYGQDFLIAPICLAFYGLALVGASRHTLGEIRYLGYLEIALGVINLFLVGHGLLFWVLGFGVLHILYGALMWNKYDRHATV